MYLLSTPNYKSLAHSTQSKAAAFFLLIITCTHKPFKSPLNPTIAGGDDNHSKKSSTQHRHHEAYSSLGPRKYLSTIYTPGHGAHSNVANHPLLSRNVP